MLSRRELRRIMEGRINRRRQRRRGMRGRRGDVTESRLWDDYNPGGISVAQDDEDDLEEMEYDDHLLDEYEDDPMSDMDEMDYYFDEEDDDDDYFEEEDDYYFDEEDDDDDDDDDYLDDELDDDDYFDEAVKRKKIKKMRGREKAKAKKYYKKNRAKIAKKAKKRRKKPAFKKKQKKRDRLTKGKKTKKGFRLVVDNDEDFSFNLDSIGSILDTMKDKV